MEVGKKIRLKENWYDGTPFAAGETGVIVKVYESAGVVFMVDAVLDSGFSDGTDNPSWPFTHHEFEVVEDSQ